LDIFADRPTDYDEQSHAEDKAWLWPRFCTAVWDALGESVARDLTAFHSVCNKLWPSFTAPIVKAEFGTRDFSRLLVAQRRLFQEEGVLLHSLLAPSEIATTTQGPKSHTLPYYAKWLLIAGYLASFNPARLDETFFMKTSERKRRKKGGGTARAAAGRPGQVRKIPRHLLAASTFTLDRLLAILHAILPDDIRAGVDIAKQIATLTSLRLLVRAGSLGSSDPLEPGGKFRVGPYVTWDYVLALARGLDFELADYTTD
jgi:origin recognition complex subunit 5